MIVRNLEDGYEVIEGAQILGVNIPKGYKTNGADIPRIFWSLYPPFKPKYLDVIILHDWLYDIALTKEDLAKADNLLKEGLAKYGANGFTQFWFHFGVRFYSKYIKKIDTTRANQYRENFKVKE